MTRPRITGSTESCRLEFTPAANVTLAAPTSISAASSNHSVGAAAASSVNPPNAAEAAIRIRIETRPRAPAASAPAIEPTPIALRRSPYVWGPPSKLDLASNGSRTWKLKPSVPTRAIIASGSASAGVART
jgi:hypothetical protein